MHPCFPLRLIALILALATTGGTYLSAAGPAPLELKVMTFNLRYASTQRPNAWPDRRPVMRHLLEQTAPDIFGTQEGLYSQLRDIASDLPAYEWIGLGRAGGSHDEHCAIFFRRDRFEPVEFDHFWLSDTPSTIGSITWGHKYIRMVTWVRLRDRSTQREFYVWNTHFDHQIEDARQKAAALLRERISAVPPTLPLLLLGDFNCNAGKSVSYETLTKGAGLTDTWTAATHRDNERLNSFHNYETPIEHEERIDWILARNPTTVTQAGIVTYHEGTQYPSDHFPVFAVVTFK
jgi:endonuclease/exonuclease/phosphatase family metal-dependent hydrolase